MVAKIKTPGFSSFFVAVGLRDCSHLVCTSNNHDDDSQRI